MTVHINDFQVNSEAPSRTRSAEDAPAQKQDAEKDVLKMLRTQESRRQRLKVDGGHR